MLTLADFNDRIIKPALIRGIKTGYFDSVLLNDSYCLEIVLRDQELKNALEERLKLA